MAVSILLCLLPIGLAFAGLALDAPPAHARMAGAATGCPHRQPGRRAIAVCTRALSVPHHFSRITPGFRLLTVLSGLAARFRSVSRRRSHRCG